MSECLSVIPPAPSTADAENEGHEHTHDLVGHQEEYGGDGHHYEYHGSGDGGLAPTRPRDLLRLGAHLLQELKRTDLRHRAYLPPSRAAAHNPLRCLDLADRAGLRLAGDEGGPPSPHPPVLGPGALAIELHSCGGVGGGPAARRRVVNA